MIFARWRARRASRALIEQLRGEIVAASRRPALYEALEAPDRIDGRFELLTLHAGLVLRRLGCDRWARTTTSRRIWSTRVFLHFDDTLREMALTRRFGLEAPESDEGRRSTAATPPTPPRSMTGSRARARRRRWRETSMAPRRRAAPRAAALADYVASLDAALAAIPARGVRDRPIPLSRQGSIAAGRPS